MHDLRIFANRTVMTEAACRHVIAVFEAAQAAFSLVLSGGSTPRALYELLTETDEIDWLKVHIFWGDERCVPPDHADSNYRMAREALLDHVPLPHANIHRIRAEQDPEQAAESYEDELRHYLGPDGRFDLVLLGMGDDGHTASLFPETAALDETERLVLANNVPQLETWRITLTAPLINRARNVAFLVAGENKAAPLREVLHGPRQPHRYPAQMIAPENGRLVWFVDQAAAANLER